MADRRTSPSLRRYPERMWRDLLSVYYANTPVWRWLKSAALIFLGFFAWTSGAVVLSVRPEWGFLTYVMAYGFLLLLWGPFTHFVVVPVSIRLRRTAEHPTVRAVNRHSGKINLSIFFALVLLFGTFTPGIMMFEFSPALGDGDGDRSEVRGTLDCDVDDDLVTCHVEGAQGIDRVVATSGDATVATADEPPFEFEVHVDDLQETRTGHELVVDYQDEDGETLRRQIRTF
ncbi:hypothetical protein [Natrarchaeobius chitinivorans]|uniref:Uncharacterized protein n=1 Tax=Natrarchaeobius chitinivorans TaxID=1679083 RepID=A0A3N6MYN1_NATCH|nr:hypothetical protein [Natrarchaeobius chitinivorans]RQG90672.1 hypothetical protein EA473_20405 [Natrarchaeobius chitinivorans]